MRPLMHAAAVLFGGALAAGSLPAQTCLGSAPFASGPVRAEGIISTATDTRSYGLGVAAGKPTGPYAFAEADRAEFSDIDESARVVRVEAGYAISPRPASTLQICPRVLFAAQSGPDFDDGFDTFAASSHTFGVGAALGGDLLISPTLHFIPAVAAAFETAHGTVTIDGESTSASSNFGLVEFAAGFVLNRKLTLRPAVSTPFGVEGGTSTFRFSIGYNFGTSHASK